MCDDNLIDSLYFANGFNMTGRGGWEEAGGVDGVLITTCTSSGVEFILESKAVTRTGLQAEFDDTGTSKWLLRQMQTFSDSVGI